MKRKLVAAIACRNQGSRLYGKPLQNLDPVSGVRIIDNIVNCLKSISCIEEIILGISEGVENEVFKAIAGTMGLRYIVGDEIDVLSRLVQCGQIAEATDIFRVTSESPFPLFELVEGVWATHIAENADAVFMDEVVDGSNFEIIRLNALVRSRERGESKHRSELCTLYIREHRNEFKVIQALPPDNLVRRDLRLTVDYPEDLAVCRRIFREFSDLAPRIPVSDIIKFLDTQPKLVEMIAPFTEAGYMTMYR
jgi:spore coat polysaccharide biosynthesis protein SpsF